MLYDEFCARFPYEETEDQLGAINATLKDLETGRPMDRLICGDVGFGKTEVALRAAFAVALEGKQVAVVVPTTLLARQHTKNFHRAVPRLSGQCRAGLAPGRDQGTERRSRRTSPTARSISSSAPTRCSARRSSSGISASSIVDEEQHFGVTPQGAAEAAARRGPCADAERDADPAHAAAGADRGARSLDHCLAAGRPSRGPHLRGAARSPDDPRGAAARTLSRRPGILRGAADRGSRRGQGFPRQERAGDEGRGRPWPDAADRDRGHHVGVLRRQIRHPAVDHDHRVRPGYSDRQHADRAPRRHVRPGAALSVARPGGALEAARLCAVHAAGAGRRSRRRPSAA